MMPTHVEKKKKNHEKKRISCLKKLIYTFFDIFDLNQNIDIQHSMQKVCENSSQDGSYLN
jgi:hypothetical protein